MSKIIVSDIEINIKKKKIKNINLSVHPPNGEVRISVPQKMSNKAIKEFVISKIQWIKKQQAKFESLELLPENQYLSGEEHYFLGNKYILNIITIDKNPAKVKIRDNTYIDLYIKESFTKEQREKVLNQWYRQELKLLIPPLVEKWENKMNVKVLEFGVKQMKTRWGTCNIMAQRIWINLELVKRPIQCLEYIIVHEMAHLLEPGHGKRFIAIMDQFLPNWRIIKAKLNGQKLYN